jgi:hypothetical protein
MEDEVGLQIKNICENRGVDECLCRWFQQIYSKRMSIDDAVLKAHIVRFLNHSAEISITLSFWRITLEMGGLVSWGGVGWDWVHLVYRPLIGLLYQPWMTDDDDECGAVGGMKIDRGNWSTRRKPAPVTLCPPQIPHDLTCVQTWATTVGSQQIIAWGMAQPDGRFNIGYLKLFLKVSLHLMTVM